MTIRDLQFLVVDDNESSRGSAVRLLVELGAVAVAEASNGRAAISRLADAARPPVDVVLSDLDMPEMDGRELIRRIAERNLAAAVIVTADLEASLEEAMRRMGDAYGVQLLGSVGKPLTQEPLSSVLERYQPDSAGSPEVEAPAINFSSVERAFDEGEIELAFQPIINMATGSLTGCETLARWYPPPHRMAVPPGFFVRVLEQAGRGRDLAEWVLRQSALQCVAWHKLGLSLQLSVNLGSLDADPPISAKRFTDILRKCGMAPEQLTLELSEASVMRGQQAESEVITELRTAGFILAIDDFGTSGKPLDTSRTASLSEIKLHRAAVQHCDEDAAVQQKLSSLIKQIRDEQLPVVATGVESAAEWRLLKQAGCTRAQGWFVAPAMSSEEFLVWHAAYEPVE